MKKTGDFSPDRSSFIGGVGEVEVSVTVGLELIASRITIQAIYFPHGWFLIGVIFLNSFINLFNKYILNSSTGGFCFVNV